MRYLIVGCGRVGSTLAKLLVAEHEVVVVDENPAAFKRLGSRFGGGVEVGTGIDYDVLKRAGAETRRRFRGRDRRRQPQRHGGADRAAHVPHSEDRRADLRSAARPDLPRSRHRDVLADHAGRATHPRPAGSTRPTQSLPSFDFGNLTSLVAAVWDAQSGKRVAEIEATGKIRIAAIRNAAACVMAAPINDMLKERRRDQRHRRTRRAGRFRDRFAVVLVDKSRDRVPRAVTRRIRKYVHLHRRRRESRNLSRARTAQAAARSRRHRKRRAKRRS